LVLQRVDRGKSSPFLSKTALPADNLSSDSQKQPVSSILSIYGEMK